jgi:predicted RNA-binding protein with PIN domain
MKPLLEFVRLPGRALDVVRRVMDEDAGFRERVAQAAEHVDLSRPAWLFVVRPEGWADELDELLAEATVAIEGRHEEQGEREARRRLRTAEESARRAEEALARERERAVRAAEELRAERRARRSAEEEAAAARRRVDAVLAERAAGRRALEEATDELRRLRAAVGQRPDLQKVARDMADAAEAAAALAARLDAAGRALSPLDTGRLPEPPAPQPEAERPPAPQPDAERPPAPPQPSPPPGRRSRSAQTRPNEGPRRPAPLPPGLRDDSPEAAEHLVRTEGTVVVVDGYNASLAWRPALPIAEQRRRLVDALEELAARTKSDVQVVFDGVEATPSTPASGPRRLVRARFSPAGVEADDIVVGLVDELPPNRPVVVASNDRAVQERAERRGANVISVSQLMAVLRREP